MKGGNKQRDTSISRETAFMNILFPKSRDTVLNISVISTGSLYGFILLVYHKPSPPDLYEFTDMYNRPIEYFLLKICITCPGNSLYLPAFPGNVGGKKSLSVKALEDEGYIQQNIFLNTVAPIKKPVTPSVFCTIIFDKDNSKNFLTTLLGNTVVDFFLGYFNKQRIDQPSRDVLNYLLYCLHDTTPLGLCILPMEYVENSVTISYYIDTTGTVDPNLMATCIAQLIRLLLVCKIINTDCHPGNILTTYVSGTPLCDIYSTLIDFGSIFNIISEKDNDSDKYKLYNSKYDEIYGEGNFDIDIGIILELQIQDLYINGLVSPSSITETQPSKEHVLNIRTLLRFMSTIDLFSIIPHGRTRPQMLTFVKHYLGIGDSPWVNAAGEITPPNQFLDLYSNPTQHEIDMCALVCRYIQCVTAVTVDTGRNDFLSRKTMNRLKEKERKLYNAKKPVFKSVFKPPINVLGSLIKYGKKIGGKTHNNRTKRKHKAKRKQKTIKHKTNRIR